MQRTRDGLLDAALVCVARDGVRGTTMAAIASEAGVAKATLYNHFRTKPGVWSALVDRELRRVAEEACAAGDGAPALDRAAQQVGGLGAVRALAQTDPQALIPLLAPAATAAWQPAREAVGRCLNRPPEADIVDVALRWLISQLLAPQLPEPRSAAAALLAGASQTAVVAGPSPAGRG